MAQILVRRGDVEYGPYSVEVAQKYLSAGQLLGQDIAWTEGMNDWSNLEDVLTKLHAAPPSNSAPNTEPHSSAGSIPVADNYPTLPAGITGWSWAAFLATPIWGIGNHVWLSLLSLIPGLGLLVMIWMGLKGRQMAWNRARWDGVEHFQLIQRRWSQWVVWIYIFSIVLTVGVFFGAMAKETKMPAADGTAPSDSPAAVSSVKKRDAAASQQAPTPEQRSVSKKEFERIINTVQSGSRVSRAEFESVLPALSFENTFAWLGEQTNEAQDGDVMLFEFNAVTVADNGQADTKVGLAFKERKLVGVQYLAE